MTARIVLLGATGYTGARTARAMARRGLAPVLAGRDPARLAALAAELGGLSTAAVDVADPTSLAALLRRGDVLVTTIGPFTRLGEPAVTAAAQVGAIYLDSTGEPPFVRDVFGTHGPLAAQHGAALLTAFGSDYVPGVLAGALALREAGDDVARVDVGYFLTGTGGGGFSRGTLRSLAAVATEPAHAWRDGALVTEPAGARMRTFDVAGRPRPGVTIGALEQFALPRLAPGLRTVDVYLGWFGGASGAVHAASRVAPLLDRVPLAGQLAGALTRSVGDLLAGRQPPGPDDAALAATTSHFVAEAFDAGGTLRHRTLLTSPDGYTITADLLAWAAGYAADHGVRGTGALDPVGAFGLDALVAGAAEAGVRPTPGP